MKTDLKRITTQDARNSLFRIYVYIAECDFFQKKQRKFIIRRIINCFLVNYDYGRQALNDYINLPCGLRHSAFILVTKISRERDGEFNLIFLEIECNTVNKSFVLFHNINIRLMFNGIKTKKLRTKLLNVENISN